MCIWEGRRMCTLVRNLGRPEAEDSPGTGVTGYCGN